MPWTDEMVESLKKMWDEGLSTGEIGKRLGVSKNSIVGKVHRLQLVARPSPIKKKAAPDENKATKPVEKSKDKTAKPASKAEPAPVVAETKPAPEPATKPQPAAKPSVAAKPQTKDKESFMNVSIPVSHAPKKPGDKVTVTDLDNHTCRWPIGDPKDENFHFCGANVRIGQTYCEEHAAIAYVKNLKK